MDGPAETGFRLMDDLTGKCNFFQIQNLVTAGTDEVGMRYCIIIVSLQPIDNADGLDDAFFLKHGDIPIDSTKT